MGYWRYTNTAAIAFPSVVASCSPAGAGTPSIPGYDHSLSNSRFELGAKVGVTSRDGESIVDGSGGNFATFIASGATLAISNQAIPLSLDDSFPGGPSAQGHAVVSYFEAVGLPADQVGAVSEEEVLAELIPASQPDAAVLVGDTPVTSIARMYNGVPIVDSIAAAILDRSGGSVFEEVFWPELGGDVLTELATFQALLANRRTGEAFVASLPAGSTGGELVIHHTGRSWDGPVQARVCYRVSMPGTVLYFDATGHLVVLPGDNGS